MEENRKIHQAFEEKTTEGIPYKKDRHRERSKREDLVKRWEKPTNKAKTQVEKTGRW